MNNYRIKNVVIYFYHYYYYFNQFILVFCYIGNNLLIKNFHNAIITSYNKI